MAKATTAKRNTSTPTKTTKRGTAALKLPMAKRLDLAQRASLEVDTLSRRIREQVAQMVTGDSFDQELTISLCLSRMKMLSDVLWDVATTEDEHDQDVAALEGFFNYFPETAPVSM